MKVSALVSEAREDAGDPNGVHPLWTNTTLTLLAVMATRHFSIVTRLLSKEYPFTTVAGTNRYQLSGETFMNCPESAYIDEAATYRRPLSYREPYSVHNWSMYDRPRYWGVETIVGVRWIVLMPCPNAVYSVVLTGTKVASDQTTVNFESDIPEPVMEGPKQRLLCRMYQIVGDIPRAREARKRYWLSVHRTRQAYSRAIKV